MIAANYCSISFWMKGTRSKISKKLRWFTSGTNSGQSKPSDPSKDHTEQFKYNTCDGYLKTLAIERRWVLWFLFTNSLKQNLFTGLVRRELTFVHWFISQIFVEHFPLLSKTWGKAITKINKFPALMKLTLVKERQLVNQDEIWKTIR